MIKINGVKPPNKKPVLTTASDGMHPRIYFSLLVWFKEIEISNALTIIPTTNWVEITIGVKNNKIEKRNKVNSSFLWIVKCKFLRENIQLLTPLINITFWEEWCYFLDNCLIKL